MEIIIVIGILMCCLDGSLTGIKEENKVLHDNGRRNK